MTMGTPQERNEALDSRIDQILDRRKVSADSRKELARAIDTEDYQTAFSILFEIMTGDEYSDYVGDSE